MSLQKHISKFLFAAIVVFFTTSVNAQPPRDNIDWQRYQDMAVKLMQQYLQVNTSNPPGNEIAAAKFLKAVFDEHGIPSEIFEYKPGRANIIARIKGNGSK